MDTAIGPNRYSHRHSNGMTYCFLAKFKRTQAVTYVPLLNCDDPRLQSIQHFPQPEKWKLGMRDISVNILESDDISKKWQHRCRPISSLMVMLKTSVKATVHTYIT